MGTAAVNSALDSDFQDKLHAMIDRQDIWQVLMRYCRGLDRLDVELARSCYFDEAIDDHGHFIGHPDDFIEWANNVSRKFLSTQHAVLNHWCELDGDNAHAETYFQFIGVAETAPHMISSGRYIDHFQRRNGEWRIANRVVIVDGSFDLSDSQYAAMLPPAYGPGETCPASRDRDDISYRRPLVPRQPRKAHD